MKIYVVIPTWNRPNILRLCVDTLLYEAKGLVADIIIVEKVYPISKARNCGIAKTPKDSIIFSIDDDCYYDENLNLGETLEQAFHKNNTGLVQITRIVKGKQLASKRRLLRTKLCWTGAGLLFHKKVWEEAGGFPKDYLDDVMFSAVVYGAGYQNYRSTLSYGYHDGGLKDGGMYEAMKQYGDKSFYPCHPEKYLVTGTPCKSRQVIPNIRNIKALPQLLEQHRKNKKHE